MCMSENRAIEIIEKLLLIIDHRAGLASYDKDFPKQPDLPDIAEARKFVDEAGKESP